MELMEKLKVLSDGAKYDVSCSSSGSSRQNKSGGIGNAARYGICHSFSNDGRCISLLKVLMSNDCVYDCKYCVNRISNDIPRCTFTPDEIADITIGFYRRNYIEGLFLSSAVTKNPDFTMEQVVRTVRLLRQKYKFNGYIHIKVIPGSDPLLIERAGNLVDRMSVNIELPTSSSLKLLAPQKNKQSILGPMGLIKSRIIENTEERRLYKSSPLFAPAGQSTQLIVGATPESDMSILNLSENLYKKYRLKRVYYSAYVPVSANPLLPAAKPPLLREHRLYQADWLLRFYGFEAGELLQSANPDFDIFLDPKCNWALKNLHLFPVEINRADYKVLLRVPGIGMTSGKRILSARRVGALDFESLKKLGVVLKRAQYFITCKGKYMKGIIMKESFIRNNLTAEKTASISFSNEYTQPTMFQLNGESYGEIRMKSLTGEI